MLKKEDISNIVKIGLILFAITAASAFVLAVVNAVTAPVIAENNAIKQAEAMRAVLPDAAQFSDESVLGDVAIENVNEVYAAKDAEGNVIGYAVMASPNGYGGEISMVVGVNTDMSVSGVDIISQSETAGLGAKCVDDDFKGQYAGKTIGINVVKNGGDENSIDAISSATITSKAVTKGVNSALEAAEAVANATN